MATEQVTIDSVSLGFMVLSNILIVFAGWNRVTERIARVEEQLKMIRQLVAPKRREMDFIDSDAPE